MEKGTIEAAIFQVQQEADQMDTTAALLLRAAQRQHDDAVGQKLFNAAEAFKEMAQETRQIAVRLTLDCLQAAGA